MSVILSPHSRENYQYFIAMANEGRTRYAAPFALRAPDFAPAALFAVAPLPGAGVVFAPTGVAFAVLRRARSAA